MESTTVMVYACVLNARPLMSTCFLSMNLQQKMASKYVCTWKGLIEEMATMTCTNSYEEY